MNNGSALSQQRHISNSHSVGFRQALINLFRYRELILALTWRNIVVNYKQSFLGIAWIVIRPVLLMLIFTVVKSFIGIESGEVPYPILTFAALMPWLLFQDATTQSINSVTSNQALIRKIYFPREVFPLTVTISKLVDLGISFLILAGLMLYYRMVPTIHVLWIPFLITYTLLASFAIGLFGAAINVYYRDVSKALPVLMQLLMYGSPVIYPLSLVHKKLVEEQIAGEWSEFLYHIYLANPMAGIIDAYQKALLYGKNPDIVSLLPGLLLVLVLAPLAYRFFKRAEIRFADVI